MNPWWRSRMTKRALGLADALSVKLKANPTGTTMGCRTLNLGDRVRVQRGTIGGKP